MDLTPTGRAVVAAVGLLVIGFALGTLSGVGLGTEPALSILAGGGGLLLLSARRPRG